MPPRDEQEFESRRQQIIDGALRVFSRKGFERATNKEIADAAGIGSPGLIYHYFKDKADLFQQVIEERLPPLQLITRHRDALMDQPPPETLTLLGNEIVAALSSSGNMALFKLVLGESLRRPAMAALMNAVGPGRGFAFLTAYLEHQMEAGNLRRTDAGAAARCFVGPLVAYVLTREVFHQPDTPTLTPKRMVEVAVEIFLRGMQPDEKSLLD